MSLGSTLLPETELLHTGAYVSRYYLLLVHSCISSMFIYLRYASNSFFVPAIHKYQTKVRLPFLPPALWKRKKKKLCRQ